MGKSDIQELIDFARKQNLVDKPLNIVIQRFVIYKGSAK